MEKHRQQYEYTFVRFGEAWLADQQTADTDYRQIVHQHAREGWRLVQVFAPTDGRQEYYELIFERTIPE